MLHVARPLVTFAIFVTLPTISACGARTELFDVGGAGGSAGTRSSSSSGNDGSGGDDGSGASAATQAAAVSGSTTSTGGEDPLPPPCEPDQRFVFLVSDNELYAFDPATVTVTSRGPIGCDVNTMGIDRHGIAYSPGGNGLVRRFDVRDPACEDVGAVSAAGFPFALFTIAFAGDGAGDDTETMYLLDWTTDDVTPSAGLTTLDRDTFELSSIVPFEDDDIWAVEPTTTPDGRLFGLAVTIDGRRDVVEIDKATARFLWSAPLGVPATGPYIAQAYWEGALYVFTGDESGTTVTRVDIDTLDQEPAGYLDDLSVIAAGVTTCP